MSSFPQVNALVPAKQDAQPEIVFSKMWVSAVQITAPDPSKPAPAVFQMKPYDPPPGTGRVSSDSAEFVQVNITDVFTEAAEAPLTVGLAVAALLSSLNLLYPKKHNETLLAQTKQLQAQVQQSLDDAAKQQSQYAALRDGPAKTVGLAAVVSRIQTATDSLAGLNAQAVSLQADLDAAVAALQAPLALPLELALALLAGIAASLELAPDVETALQAAMTAAQAKVAA